MKYLFLFIYFILFDYVFFGLKARSCGKKCNFDCTKCKNWACTNGTKYSKNGCYPVRNWHKWCNKEVF